MPRDDQALFKAYIVSESSGRCINLPLGCRCPTSEKACSRRSFCFYALGG